jgi:hypothetical protein
MFLEVDPHNKLIPKIAKGLEKVKSHGRWNNTQDNAFALLAMDKYFRLFENETPNFLTRLWLGSDFVGEEQFQGRSSDTSQLNIPMPYIINKGDCQLIMEKEGEGRMYYRIGLKYAPVELQLPAVNYGLKVSDGLYLN